MPEHCFVQDVHANGKTCVYYTPPPHTHPHGIASERCIYRIPDSCQHNLHILFSNLPSYPTSTRNQKEAVVVSSRALYNNELFEVELGSEAESMVSSTGGSIRRKKTNAGAIRIGVTGHR